MQESTRDGKPVVEDDARALLRVIHELVKEKTISDGSLLFQPEGKAALASLMHNLPTLKHKDVAVSLDVSIMYTECVLTISISLHRWDLFFVSTLGNCVSIRCSHTIALSHGSELSIGGAEYSSWIQSSSRNCVPLSPSMSWGLWGCVGRPRSHGRSLPNHSRPEQWVVVGRHNSDRR